MDLNYLILAVAVLSLFIYFKTNDVINLIFGFVCIYIITYVKNKKINFIENFTTPKKSEDVTEPTNSNPLMNVMPMDYSNNPNRPPAHNSYEPQTEKKINDSIKQFVNKNNDNNLFRDVGDNIEFDKFVRQFTSNPSTTIPNDQKGFAKYLFGDMKSVKEKKDYINI